MKNKNQTNAEASRLQVHPVAILLLNVMLTSGALSNPVLIHTVLLTFLELRKTNVKICILFVFLFVCLFLSFFFLSLSHILENLPCGQKYYAYQMTAQLLEIIFWFEVVY